MERQHAQRRNPGIVNTNLSYPIINPLDITNCILWWSADSITGLLDTEAITYIPDQSTYANDATNDGNPTYRTNQLNGFPAIQHGGQGFFLDTEIHITSGTYIMMRRPTDITNDAWPILGHDGGNQVCFRHNMTNDRWYFSYTEYITLQHPVYTVKIKAATYSGEEVRLYTDGVLNEVVASNADIWIDKLYGHTADTYELLVFDRVLTEPEIRGVTHYILDKYYWRPYYVTLNSLSHLPYSTWGDAGITYSGHTVGAGNNRLLVLTWRTVHDNSYLPTGITWNGDALTKLEESGASGGPSPEDQHPIVQIWYLKQPDVGNYDLIISQSGAYMGMGSISDYINVNQTTPFGTSAGNVYGNGGTANTSCAASDKGDMVLASVGYYDTYDPVLGKVAITEPAQDIGTNNVEWGYWTATHLRIPDSSGTTPMHWTFYGTPYYAACMVAIKKA
jgi:hypothetical protein